MFLSLNMFLYVLIYIFLRLINFTRNMFCAHRQLPLNPRSLHNPLYIAFCYMMHVNSTPEPTQHRALVLTREAAEHATVKTPTTSSTYY
jgi:hypothetical protein